MSLDFTDYKLNDSKKIMGDLENGSFPNTIIFLTKKVSYDSFKDERRVDPILYISNT